MGRMTKTTRGWCSPMRYVQGPGEFDNIRFYTDKFGKRICAFIDQFFFERFTRKLKDIYTGDGYDLHTFIFETEVSLGFIDACVETVRPLAPEFILGIGGGKTIDVAKATAYKLSLPFIIVPTAASTDAPTSSLSVLYSDEGRHTGEFFYDRGPDLLVVDSKIIAEAPTRFLVAGMGDALATLIESEANWKNNTPNLVYNNDGGYRHTLAGQAVARACEDALFQYGRMAKVSCDAEVVTEALENIIEANILLSGLGFENNATCGAHSVHDGLTALPESSKTLHGERVAFGCLVQLVAETAPAGRIHEILRFMTDVGLPVCMEDMFMPNDDASLRTVAKASMHSCWGNMPFVVNEDVVFAALKTTDAIGRKWKQQQQR